VCEKYAAAMNGTTTGWLLKHPNTKAGISQKCMIIYVTNVARLWVQCFVLYTHTRWLVFCVVMFCKAAVCRHLWQNWRYLPFRSDDFWSFVVLVKLWDYMSSHFMMICFI